MTERYSHPPEDGGDGVHLRDHLADVAGRVDHVVPDGATTPAGEPLVDVVETLAWLHDLGKATTYFQQYIGVLPGEPDGRLRRYHAPLGSFAAYYALDARGFDTETCLAGFVAVAKHHGRLPDVPEYVFTRSHRRDDPGERPTPHERQQTAVGDQIADIDEHVQSLAAAVLDDATDGAGSWRAFRDGVADLLGEIAGTVASSDTGADDDPDGLSDESYALVLQCWSALVLADKTSAAGAPEGPGTYTADPPSAARLDDHVEAIEERVDADPDGDRAERLNHHRSRAREAVLDNAASFADDGGGVATLTLPTGLGKTFAGLSAAFELRDRLGGDRVVYALPFTSIIDQVVDDVEDVYADRPTGRLLTAHHHLAETTIRDDAAEGGYDDADLSDDVAGMLGESWRAGLTVSTFVQLFESLAAPENTQSMKLPALYDSVVVLDEPQSLPLDWWKLVPRLIAILTEQYDATVIVMTATQPRLFEYSEAVDDPTELVDDPATYFETVERVTYELDDSAERYIADQTGPKSYADAAGELLDAVDSGESVLAVCNTIDSTRRLTDTLTDRVGSFVDVAEQYTERLDAVEGDSEPDEDDDAVDPEALAESVADALAGGDGTTAVIHLSTRLRPVDRLTLVETAKHLTEQDVPVAVISTQLVEAGVDISFDRVYRDLAPIDSVVQAAGRCNRSFERERGRVVVWWLDAPDDQEKTPAAAVYNRSVSLLPVAAEALASVRDDDGELSESDVARTAVERYYRTLREEKDVGKQEYVEYVDDADGDALAECSLIDQRLSADVLVCRTDSDRALVSELREARVEHQFERVDALLDRTKPLRISVPYYREDSETAQAIRDLQRLFDDRGLYVLDVRQHPDHFDQRIGFDVPESSVEHQFL